MAWVQALVLLSALAGTVEPSSVAPARLITVYGEAAERVAPDFVVVKLSVQESKPSPDESFTSEDQAMSSLQAALKAAGVAPRDMQTLGPTTNRIYRPGVAGSPPVFTTTVRGLVSVSVHEIDRLSDVVHAAQAHGAEIDSLHYDTTGRAAREDALRAAAAEDARRKAEIYAEAVGLKLGDVHTVNEEGANIGFAAARNPPQEEALLDNAASQAGAIVLREGVYISFDLAPK